MRAELLDLWPAGRDPATVILPDPCRLVDVRDAIERSQAWVLAGRTFVEYAGFIPADLVKMSGRPRVSDKFSIRFVRASGSLGFDEVSLGVTLFEYTGVVPDGYETSFRNVQERSFTEGVEGVVGDSDVIQTTRRAISSGVDYSGKVALMPGGWARVEGTLSVSAFVGRGLDRNQTAVPLELDVRRGQWAAVHLFTGLDAAAAFGFRGDGLSANAGGDRIRVDIRVE